LLLQAANAGYVHSQNLVGYCYSEGLGTQKDPGLALYWFRAAAQDHHKEALFNLALAYENGEGIVANPRRAVACYKQAAKLGDVPAQCNLGVAYLAGLGVRPDSNRGIYWTRKASQNGDAKAQYNLAMEYLSGARLPRNMKHAKALLSRAAKQGLGRAKRALRQFRDTGSFRNAREHLRAGRTDS
jgi:uncharacterized protein